jgi:hypothetical protein
VGRVARIGKFHSEISWPHGQRVPNGVEERITVDIYVPKRDLRYLAKSVVIVLEDRLWQVAEEDLRLASRESFACHGQSFTF